MPLVRISLIKRIDGLSAAIGRTVYQTMKNVLGVPDKDNFQLIDEHSSDTFVYDPDYLGITRTQDLVIIQITLNEGRTTAAKKSFYAELARRLNSEHGIRLEDVFVNLVEVKKENWSFGLGIAQYADETPT
ncbi:tautomerase family protein [Pseudomonas akapageensis]|uniref:tautomerase family protein n=1 Tax=Pseudomonas akapageensis TaxID=2609961 RepID=UPI00140CF493|nr:tautomerase family protein [Pseudomonas akapageensis]